MPNRSTSSARLEFLGPQRILIGREQVSHDSERLFAMLVRLSVPLGRIASRQTIVEAVWPESDEASARHNLRQTVYKARELGLIVEASEDGLRLDPRYWSCDWEDPEGDVAGQWLEGYNPTFSESLDAWVSSQRIGVHALIRPRIIRTLQAARAAGDLMRADQYAIQLLGIDELNEEATLTRAEWLVMHGAKSDALRLLDAYLNEIGRMHNGADAALPAMLLRRRIAEKLPAVAYRYGSKHHGSLIGRAREMQKLSAGLFDARAGRGGAFMIQGGIGTGKTRLLYETKLSAVLHGMQMLDIVCETSRSGVPFAAMRTIVTAVLKLPGGCAVSPEALATLNAWLTSEDFAPDDCPLAEIEDLLEAVSEETPLLVMVEHAHRMDAKSLSALDRAYRRGLNRHHMMVMTASTRAVPMDEPVELEWLDRLALRPMSSVDVRSVVTAYAEQELKRATGEEIRFASVFAEGVPMYGIEMLGLMCDKGSPDKIPWQVQLALDQAGRELSELQLRVLTLGGLLGNAARQLVVTAALKVTGEELAEALDGLETPGYVQCEEGVLKVSGLMAEEAAKRVRASVKRMDALRAATALVAVMKEEENVGLFFAALQAYVTATEEGRAAKLLDKWAGWLLRSATADEVVFGIGALTSNARSEKLRQLLSAVLNRVVVSPLSAQGLASPGFTPGVPSSLENRVNEKAGVGGESYQQACHDAYSRACDAHSPPGMRIADAVATMIFADNLGDLGKLNSAFAVVRSLQACRDVQPFDVARAELIFRTCTFDISNVVECAERLAIEARRVRDIELACLGFRNAADALQQIGQGLLSSKYLHESLALATRYKYPSLIAQSYCCLAIHELMQCNCEASGAYLNAALENDIHSLGSEDYWSGEIEFASLWRYVLLGDAVSGAKHAKRLVRLFGKDLNMAAKTSVSASRLATSSGRWSVSMSKDLECCLTGLTEIGPRPIAQRAAAAILLSTKARPERPLAIEAVMSWVARTESLGVQVWPFVSQLLALDAGDAK
jgi:AAA ATPase domain